MSTQTAPDIQFMANTLLEHHERMKVLRANIKAEMAAALEGDDPTTIYPSNCRDHAAYEQLRGVADRLKRDLAHALAERPSLLIKLAEQVTAKDEAST